MKTIDWGKTQKMLQVTRWRATVTCMVRSRREQPWVNTSRSKCYTRVQIVPLTSQDAHANAVYVFLNDEDTPTP